MSAISCYKTISDLMRGKADLQDISVSDMEEMFEYGFITVLKNGKVELVTQEG
jgi:hypothetical protein